MITPSLLHCAHWVHAFLSTQTCFLLWVSIMFRSFTTVSLPIFICSHVQHTTHDIRSNRCLNMECYVRRNEMENHPNWDRLMKNEMCCVGCWWIVWLWTSCRHDFDRFRHSFMNRCNYSYLFRARVHLRENVFADFHNFWRLPSFILSIDQSDDY